MRLQCAAPTNHSSRHPKLQDVASSVRPGIGGSLIGASPGPPGLRDGAFCGSLGSGVRGGGE